MFNTGENVKCFVVYATCGQGHKKAATSIADHFGFRNLDFLDFTFPFLRNLYVGGYRFTVKKLPLLWVFFFEITRFKVIRWLVDLFHLVLFYKFDKFLNQEKPDIVITTHFFPIFFLQRLKKKTGCKIVTLITDFGVHPFWLSKFTDLYCVACSDTKKTLKSFNISEEKISVTGYPLRAGFREDLNVDKLRDEFGFDKRKVLLLFSSTQGDIPYLSDILDMTKDFNLLVISGNENKTKKVLENYRGDNLKFFSYYEEIWRLMRLSCAIITKPGGLTVYESLTVKVPLIFTHFIWGQEKGNLDVVVKNNAGVYVKSFKELNSVLSLIKSNTFKYVPFSLEGDIFATIDNFVQKIK